MVMKFPITREYLQTITLEDLEKSEKEEEIQKKLSEYIRCVCNEFKQHLSRNLEIKQYTWFGLHLIPISSDPTSPDDKYLLQFIIQVREQFIGCHIRTDARRTYIVIDWS